MKWPLVLTGLGTAAVVAAVIVNDTYTPDDTPIAPPDLRPDAIALATGTSGLASSTVAHSAKEEPAGGPVFDLIRIAHDGHAVIAGQAVPGSRVVVFDDEIPIGSVLADARGEWVFLPSAPLQPGEHRLALSAQSPDHPVVVSKDLMVVIVPEPEEDIAGMTAQPQEQPLAITVLRNGRGPALVFPEPR